jgi:hypothetical protein
MDRHHRLEFENVLRAVMPPDAEVGVVLEGQHGEIADRILRLPGDIILVRLADGIVIEAPRIIGRGLLGVRGSAGEKAGRSQSREFGLLLVGAPVHVSCPFIEPWKSGETRHSSGWTLFRGFV